MSSLLLWMNSFFLHVWGGPFILWIVKNKSHLLIYGAFYAVNWVGLLRIKVILLIFMRGAFYAVNWFGLFRIKVIMFVYLHIVCYVYYIICCFNFKIIALILRKPGSLWGKEIKKTLLVCLVVLSRTDYWFDYFFSL